MNDVFGADPRWQLLEVRLKPSLSIRLDGVEQITDGTLALALTDRPDDREIATFRTYIRPPDKLAPSDKNET